MNWLPIALSEYEDGYRDGLAGNSKRYSSVPYLRGYEDAEAGRPKDYWRADQI